jgi:hypothetical protein
MYNPRHGDLKEDDAKKATRKTNLKITKTKWLRILFLF